MTPGSTPGSTHGSLSAPGLGRPRPGSLSSSATASSATASDEAAAGLPRGAAWPRLASAGLVFVLVAAVAAQAAAQPAAQAAAVAPPEPPRSYPLPRGAAWVSSGAELARELAKDQPQDIILRDGLYQAPGPFNNACGHRVFAENQGQAVLTSGFSIGDNYCSGGGRIQGLTFDLTDPQRAANNAAIEVWGKAQGTLLADLVINGHGTLDSGIAARQPEGLKIQRIVAANFRSWGIFVDADDFDRSVSQPALLEDLDVANVSRPVPQSSDGTAEACIWVGNTAVGRRFKVRNCAWMGMWTGTAAKQARFADIDIDDIGSPTSSSSTGLYLEHFTTDTLFERVRIGPNVTMGVACEWADPAWGSRPACDGVVIQDSLIDSRCVGAYLDDGTRNTTLRRTTFVHQQSGAVAIFNDNHNILYDTSGNDYGMMKAGAPIILNKNNPC